MESFIKAVEQLLTHRNSAGIVRRTVLIDMLANATGLLMVESTIVMHFLTAKCRMMLQTGAFDYRSTVCTFRPSVPKHSCVQCQY